MAKKNSINNKSGDLTIDPGASGDSFIQFDISTTGEFRIGVDDTDDSFRISQGSALGTNDTFTMTADGINLMPLTPCSLAHNSSSDVNVTGDGTVVSPVDYDTSIFDQGSNFASDTFTAPVTGVYLLSVQVFWQDLGAHTGGLITLVTSNRSYQYNAGDPSAYRGGINMSHCFSLIVDMDASDTALVSTVVSGSTKTVDIFGAGGMYTYFGANLIA